MPIDINLLRKEKGGNPESVKKSQKDRFADEAIVDSIIDCDERWRKSNYQMETLRMEFGKINKEIADKKKSSKGKDQCLDLVEKSKEKKAQIEKQQQEAEDLKKEVDSKLGLIGNVLHKDVPIFKDEENNQVAVAWGQEKIKDLPVVPFEQGRELGKLHHHEIMALLDMVEFERGSKVAGHRGYYLKGNGVLLNQALINFGLATLVKNEYTPLQPPYYMKSSIMHETCQLSDFEENLYQVEGTDDKDPLYLIATSEQPISAMHKNEFIEPQDLPIRYGGNSSCFRKEAGSAGRDVWGIFRVHQFEKIEQFILTSPEKSWEELDRMIGTSQEFYKALGLPYQVIKIVSGALNDAAAMKMDLEAYFPGYQSYRELVSCSNCTDYQSRALEIRMAVKNLEKGQSTPFVHLLNGTLCATERTMCCIVENYQTPEGLNIPECLQPYMGGVKFIPYNDKKVKDWQAKLIEDDKLAAAKAAKKGKGGDKPKKDDKKPAEAKKAPAAAPKVPAAAAKAKVAAPAAALTMTYPSKTDKEFNAKLNFYESVLEKSKYVYGNQLTSKDAAFFKVFEQKVAQINPVTHPYVFGHFCLVSKLNPKMRDSLPVVEEAEAPKKEEDDLDDLFGDDDDDAAETAKKVAAAAKEKGKKKVKKVAIAMSLVMLEVKPLDDTIDLDALAQKVFTTILQEGLYWKTEFKKEPVAFGIFKLIIGFSLEDEKVSVDDVVERIEALEDLVQSVEIAVFNKI